MKNQKTTLKTCDKVEKIPIEVVSLTKRYQFQKTPAIKNINFIVKDGSFHGFVGPNGAGKTTVIKAIIGAFAKYKGQIKIFNKTSGQISIGEISYIPTITKFPDNMTVLQYLINMCILSDISKKEAKISALEMLQNFEMEKFKNKNPNKLSSGQKKKVILAQAMIAKPKIIIMDEPTANLDPDARIVFFEALNKMKTSGTTVFISSHNLDELQRHIDYLTIIYDGNILYSNSVEFTKNSKTSLIELYKKVISKYKGGLHD